MKKILINIFSLLFLVGISNYATACCGSCDKSSDSTNVEQASEKNKSCSKTAKTSCCKSKSKKGSFNFNKTNNYGQKSSCSKTQSKKCCKSKAQKSDKSENKEDTLKVEALKEDISEEDTEK